MKNLSTWLDDQLSCLHEGHLLRERRVLQTTDDGCVLLDDQRYVNFGSNDYLGFLADDRLRSAHEGLCSTTHGSGASPLITGRTSLHAKLETEIARWKKTESAILFPTGFAANVGTISALMESGDFIFSDARNHASIIDGCRLSKAKTILYPHADLDGLTARLDRAPSEGRRLIVTDSLFSMDGDIVPLDKLCEIAQSRGAMVMIDEAHATGVYGESGSGLAEEFGVTDRIDVHVGTLSKAVGSVGGFVAGSSKLIEWLANRARTYVFSTSPPPTVCAASLASLRLIREEPGRRRELLSKAAHLRSRLQADGWDIGQSASQIIPVKIGDPETTMRWSRSLLADGFLVPGIRPPTVPKGESLLRISLSYTHLDSSIDNLVMSLNRLRESDCKETD